MTHETKSNFPPLEQPVVTHGGHRLYRTLEAMCRRNGVRRRRFRGDRA